MTTPAQPRTGHRRIFAATRALRASSRGWSRAAGGLAVLAVVLASAAPALAVPANRAAALEAWLGIQDGTRVPAGWTGDSATCVVGTESAPSLAATLGAVNTLRDFAGVAPVRFDPALNERALAAAMMMRAARDLEHYPPPSWPCYSANGANGANNSNLYLGASGAQAMTGYFGDLGHRGPMLDPRAATFGSGSTGSSNALYVRGAWVASPVTPPMIAWPPPGDVPWPLVGSEWSVSLDMAGTVDASRAQVQVKIAGRPLTVSGLVDFRRSTYATSASRLGALLKWDVAIAAAEFDADATMDVTIDGITVDGAPRRFSYSIRAMRAQVPTPTTFTATRTASTVTVAWAGATERGVPITGYRVAGFDGRFAIDHSAAPTARSVTLPYAEPAKTLSVTVTPQSRAGYPPVLVHLEVPPPKPPTPPPPPKPGPVTPPPALVTPPPPLPTSSSPPRPLNGSPVGGPPSAPGARARIVGKVTLRVAGSGSARAGSLIRVRADVRDERRVSYRWRRDGRPMSAATRSSYRVRRVDRGHSITCRLTAVGRDGVATKRTSSSRRIARR